MKTPCIILWNRVFECYEIYNLQAHYRTSYATLEETILGLNSRDIQEVPINSRIGRQILARIGARRYERITRRWQK